MTTMAPQITGLTVVYSTVYSDEDQRKHQSSASLAFVWGIVGNSPGPVNSHHKGPVTRKMFPFDDVILISRWGNAVPAMNIQCCHRNLVYDRFPQNAQRCGITLHMFSMPSRQQLWWNSELLWLLWECVVYCRIWSCRRTFNLTLLFNYHIWYHINLLSKH